MKSTSPRVNSFNLHDYRTEVYINLKRLWAQYACADHLKVMQQLEDECGYSPNEIPQLDQVNAFLKGDS